MPPSPSDIMEKIHLLQIEQAGTDSDLETLVHEKDLLWQAVDKIRDAVSSIRIQVAGIVGTFSIVQTALTAWIVYKITKGG